MGTRLILKHFESGVRRGLGKLSVIFQDYASSIWAGANIMAKTNLRLVTPDLELRTVTLRRRSNRDMGRDREH